MPKDKFLLDQLAGTVYCFECEDCHKCYIGESARPLGKRIKEHITTRFSSTSAVSEHLKTAKHNFDSDKDKILARDPKDFSRKILQVIHIRGGGRKRLPKFKFSAKFPIGLHVILQIQIKKFENDCFLMWKIILTENPSRFNVEPLLK